MVSRLVCFGPFRLDPARGQLLCEGRAVELRRRTWEVLCVLVSRPGELIAKDEILAAVWRDAVVSEQTLSTSIAEIRRALGDSARAPRFVETVHGRGFRFLAPVTAEVASEDASPIGREAALRTLLGWWEEAGRGRRQLGFVSGEVGIGKTALIDAFRRRLAGSGCVTTTGQCLEHRGEGEAYMPVLHAIRGLFRRSDGGLYAETAREHAPPWLVEALGAGAAGSASPTPFGVETHTSTLRHLVALIEALAARAPLLLVLEDVHWSDASTVDLLNFLAQGREPARLLVVCTLRQPDALAAVHPVLPVMRELSRKQACVELTLEGLGAADAAALLVEHLGPGRVPTDTAEFLTAYTGGNPFFLHTMLDHWRESGRLLLEDGAWVLRGGTEEIAMPAGVLAAIEPRLEFLSTNDQVVLEVAAVVGATFHTETVSRTLGGALDSEAVEKLCDRLVSRGEILAYGEDRTYRFRHALYEQALYGRVPARRRQRLHARVAASLEGVAAPAELASHYERADEPARAVTHYGDAVRAAKARYADCEVSSLCSAALRLLAGLPESRERDERELALQLELGAAMLARGYGVPEQGRVFERVCELAARLGNQIVHFLGQGGLFFYRMSSGDVPAGRLVAERMLELADVLPEEFGVAAHTALGVALFNEGDLRGAEAHLQHCSPRDERMISLAQVDLSVFRLAALADTYACLGQLAEAAASSDATLTCAARGGRPFDLCNGHRMAAELHAILENVDAVREHAQRAIALAEEHGFPQLLAIGRILAGWAVARSGDAVRGLRAIDEGLLALEDIGYRLTTSAFRLRQAEAALLAGDLEAGERAVCAGLAYGESSGEQRHQSDLLRLRGAIHAQRPDGEAAAAEAFEAAARVAAARGAVLQELRALVALSALPRCCDGVDRLRRRLAESFGALPAAEREAAARILTKPGAADSREIPDSAGRG